MYCSDWEPPELCERRRSLNFKVSILRENQILWGHSGKQLEWRQSLISIPEISGTSCNISGSTWDYLATHVTIATHSAIYLGCWWIFSWRTAGIVRDSQDSPELEMPSMYDISKKHFRPGGMAASEWTCSVRAVRDTPVADYSAPSVDTTRRVAYRSPIAVSPFLLALSVSYCPQTLWRCGQLWPYIGMGSLVTHLHRNCRCENISSRSSYIKLEERRKKVRRYDTTRPWGSMQLHGSTKSRKERMRTKVGKDRVCIFVVWQDEMKMRCCLSTPESPEYILRVAHSTSVTRVSLYTHRRSLTIYLEATIELVWRCTWRPRSNELRDALGGRDRSSLEMHWEAVIERVWRWTSRPGSSELRDTVGGRDRVNWEMHSEAEIERV